MTTCASGSWKTIATCSLSSATVRSRVSAPATRTDPSRRAAIACGTSPSSASASVDLPQPEGPSTSTTSPGRMSSETPSGVARVASS